MAVHFKFLSETPPEVREDLLTKLSEGGALTARRLFADVTDPELAALYVVEASDESIEKQLLKALGDDSAVEFVEKPARRKLIR